MFSGSIPLEKIPRLVVAWEDVSKKIYDPTKSKFLPSPETTKTSSAPQQGALPDLSSLQQGTCWPTCWHLSVILATRRAR